MVEVNERLSKQNALCLCPVSVQLTVRASLHRTLTSGTKGITGSIRAPRFLSCSHIELMLWLWLNRNKQASLNISFLISLKWGSGRIKWWRLTDWNILCVCAVQICWCVRQAEEGTRVMATYKPQRFNLLSFYHYGISHLKKEPGARERIVDEKNEWSQEELIVQRVRGRRGDGERGGSRDS